MQGKIVVVTGGTSGIGEVTAVRLAEQGARIVLIARDRDRADATVAKLHSANAAAEHLAHLADLTTLAEMKRVAAAIAAAEPRIDVLVNNAGAIFPRREVTGDGLERTFAVDHMGYFAVTLGLIERLRATPGARVVSTASVAHRGAKLDFDDLQMERGWSAFGAYGRAKLANILFTRALARRLEASGATANCFHPGAVASRFGDNAGPVAKAAKTLFRRAMVSPEQGAQTLIWLASSPHVTGVSGRYFARRAQATPSAAARDDTAAERLWAESARMAARA